MATSAKSLATGALRYLSLVPWWGWLGAGSLLVLGMRAGEAAASELGPGVPGSKGPPQPPGAPPLLKLGSSGPWVTFLQVKLGVVQSGTFDAPTDAAVISFQKQKGLVDDGVVGPKTWAALGVTGAVASPKPGGGGAQPPPGDFLGSAGNIDLSDSIATREQQILAAIAAGDVNHQWTPIQWSVDGHVVKALVSRRAVAITDGAGGRLIVNVSFKNAQKVGDLLGGAMLTTRMADEIWRLADVKIAPLTRPWSQDGTMSKTSRMVEQSAALDAKIADNGVALVANEGKDWVLTRRWLTAPDIPEGTFELAPDGKTKLYSRHNGANFGWYVSSGGAKTPSPGGETVIQPIGLTHDKGHTDYSQLLRFVKLGSVTIDGSPVDLETALSDPETSHLLQDEGGTLPGLKHPDFEGVA